MMMDNVCPLRLMSRRHPTLVVDEARACLQGQHLSGSVSGVGQVQL